MIKFFKLIKRWLDLSHHEPWRKHEEEQKETETSSKV
jgi:hypothetical protein